MPKPTIKDLQAEIAALTHELTQVKAQHADASSMLELVTHERNHAVQELRRLRASFEERVNYEAAQRVPEYVERRRLAMAQAKNEAMRTGYTVRVQH